MYISTSPCGDGRLNSPYEISTDCKFFLFFFKSFMVPEKHKGVHCLCSCHRTFRFIEMISWISFNVTLSVSCTGLTPKIFYLWNYVSLSCRQYFSGTCQKCNLRDIVMYRKVHTLLSLSALRWSGYRATERCKEKTFELFEPLKCSAACFQILEKYQLRFLKYFGSERPKFLQKILLLQTARTKYLMKKKAIFTIIF